MDGRVLAQAARTDRRQQWIEEGMGALVPRPPAEVLARRFGDCERVCSDPFWGIRLRFGRPCKFAWRDPAGLTALAPRCTRCWRWR